MSGRLTFLVSSPRVAPGLLSRSAWAALEAADVRYAVDLAEPLPAAIIESGLEVRNAPAGPPDVLARALVERASTGHVLWLGTSSADPGLTDAVANEVSSRHTPPEIGVLVGAWDTPGARLLDAVAVMDRLRSPGGCPWDARQTHESLAPYATEEAAELVEAIASGDRAHLAEELGDVLLQVLFHARVAEDSEDEPFDIDTVAGVLVDKLVRRHPHVFADATAATPAEVEQQWARIKAEEAAAKARAAGSAPH